MLKTKFINKEKVVKKLKENAKKAIKRNKNIKRIILFGSWATDNYTIRSDADLLIILRKSSLRFINRIPKLSYYFLDAPVPVDIFPLTEEEAKRNPIAKKAFAEGILLSEI